MFQMHPTIQLERLVFWTLELGVTRARAAFVQMERKTEDGLNRNVCLCPSAVTVAQAQTANERERLNVRGHMWELLFRVTLMSEQPLI